MKNISIDEFSAQRQHEFVLKAIAVELSEILVKGISERKHNRYLKRFSNRFLGSGPNAKYCKILNPEVLDFRNQNGKIIASSNAMIKIENLATGFLVQFYLEHFEMEGSRVTYAGKPIFKELDGKLEKRPRFWERNRSHTFQGSTRHFYESLLNNSLKQDGFQVYSTEQNDLGQFHNTKAIKGSKVLIEDESNQERFITIEKFLKVVYRKGKFNSSSNREHNSSGSMSRKERTTFLASPSNSQNEFPTSYLFARKAKVKIDQNGRLLEPDMILVYGSWANEGAADLLAFNYSISTNERATNKKNEKPKRTEKMIQTPTMKGFSLGNLLIPIAEIHDGGPPRDGIPSIDRPNFVGAQEADFMQDKESVLGVSFNGIAKAYPTRILDRHEIVNDDLNGIKVAITFCPLCGSGVGVISKVNGIDRTFGVSGLLYNSDVLLYDRETESLWSQIMGKAISGNSSDQELQLIPTENTSWEDWKSRHPETLVLTTETGFERDYETKAYGAYLVSDRLMFPVNNKDSRISNKEKIIGLEIDGKFKAYPFNKLKSEKFPITDVLNGQEILIYYDRKAKSARIEDAEGNVLPAITMFWFAWYAFHPDTSVYE